MWSQLGQYLTKPLTAVHFPRQEMIHQVQSLHSPQCPHWCQNQMPMGGTSVLSIGNIGHYAKGTGRDLTGLGWGCWMCFQGQNGITLCFVMVYGPCNSNDGETNVRKQHIQYLNNHNDNRDPKTAFLEDLKKPSKPGLMTVTRLLLMVISTWRSLQDVCLQCLNGITCTTWSFNFMTQLTSLPPLTNQLSTSALLMTFLALPT
jgi:hypothetical protein